MEQTNQLQTTPTPIETPAVSIEKPTSVKVIGWLFIAVSLMMMLSTIWGLVIQSFMAQQRVDFQNLSGNTPAPFRLVTLLFQNYQYLAIFQFVFACFLLFFAIQFLKLRPRARTALEIITWIGLFYSVGFGIFWVLSFLSITSTNSVGFPIAIQTMAIVMAIVVISLFSVPEIIIIKLLRGKTIKTAFNH